MAKIKDPQTPEENLDLKPGDGENQDKDNPKEPTKEETKKQKSQAKIPAEIDQILKCYPNYESLYVDKFGSVYTTDTKEKLRKGAVLYKNPHYNA